MKQKMKLSKKAVKNGLLPVIAADYCQLQNLLSCIYAIAYSSGIYGWSCDYYLWNYVIISMGYSPVGKRVSKELVDEYENKAIKLTCNSQIDWDDRQNQLEDLLTEFVEKALDEKEMHHANNI